MNVKQHLWGAGWAWKYSVGYTRVSRNGRIWRVMPEPDLFGPVHVWEARA